jgi:hypothetical protein
LKLLIRKIEKSIKELEKEIKELTKNDRAIGMITSVYGNFERFKSVKM